MAASDHLNPQQFYHGSAHEFAPGDLVTSIASRGAIEAHPAPDLEQNKVQRSHVFATAHFGDAVKFSGAGNGEMWPDEGHVYHVEPTGPTEPDTYDAGRGWGAASVRSKAPFRVVREVGRGK